MYSTAQRAMSVFAASRLQSALHFARFAHISASRGPLAVLQRVNSLSSPEMHSFLNAARPLSETRQGDELESTHEEDEQASGVHGSGLGSRVASLAGGCTAQSWFVRQPAAR